MSFEKIKVVLDKANELLAKLESEGKTLDDLQKAQVLQSLVQAKAILHKELQEENLETSNPDLYSQYLEQVSQLETKIQEQAESIDFPKVQKTLAYLEEGVSELIERKNSGEKVVEE